MELPSDYKAGYEKARLVDDYVAHACRRPGHGRVGGKN